MLPFTRFAGILTTGALVLVATAATSHAQTYPVTGVVRFETGMRRLATITLVRDAATSVDRGAEVDWGDGTPVQRGWLVDCGGFLNRTCDVYGTHRYLALGAYTITIRYTSPGLPPSPASVTTTATVLPISNFVILSIGDSVASGEGNPVIPRTVVYEDTRPNPLGGTSLGLWNDPGSNYYELPPGQFDSGACHRTGIGGPAMAAGRLRSTNPGSDITFIHVACSGAKINDGAVANVIVQLREARTRLENARVAQGGLPDGPPINIDALLISAGANNVAGGFGTLVTSCLGFGDCSTDPTLRADMNQSFAELPGRYAALASEIASPGAGTRGTVSDTYITEYFDPTRDENGDFPGEARSAACVAGLISPPEWEFLYNEMVVPLNDAVSAAAITHGWHLVSGIANDFRTHGYCAQPGPFALFGDSWVVKAPESLNQQGDQNGTAHPNLLGHADYRDHIVSTVITFTPPRTTATGVTGGQPYTFGTWTPHDVEVTLTAINPISQSGVARTYYAVDAAACAPPALTGCSLYTGPFLISASGTHTVTSFSENLHGALEPADSVIVRIDKDPPRMTCAATPGSLWPPNGKLIPVATSVEAVDEVSGPAPFVLISVEGSDGAAPDDIQAFTPGVPDTNGFLRARRSGAGSGRIYTLTYESADALGNVGTCTVPVSVPHDRGRGRGHN
jgi:hypothetical protein